MPNVDNSRAVDNSSSHAANGIVPEIEDGPSRGEEAGAVGFSPGGRAERAWTMSRCQQYYTQSLATTQVRHRTTLWPPDPRRLRGKPFRAAAHLGPPADGTSHP